MVGGFGGVGVRKKGRPDKKGDKVERRGVKESQTGGGTQLFQPPALTGDYQAGTLVPRREWQVPNTQKKRKKEGNRRGTLAITRTG